MIANTIQNNRLQPHRTAGFQPGNYFAGALELVFRIDGMGMYRVLHHPATRSRLEALIGRVERAWQAGERTGRWAAFGRSVDRLKWAWLEMLDADVAPPHH